MTPQDFLIEMLDDALDAACDFGKNGSDVNADALNKAVDKFHTYLSTLEVKSTIRYASLLRQSKRRAASQNPTKVRGRSNRHRVGGPVPLR